MIGLDTNVLVRYLVQDDPAQGKQATRLIHGAAERSEMLFLNHIVLCETGWVLRRAYGYTREELAGLIETLLLTRQIEVEEKDLVWKALRDYKASTAGFADCLIGARNRQAGCQRTVSFDKTALTLEAFSAIGG